MASGATVGAAPPLLAVATAAASALGKGSRHAERSVAERLGAIFVRPWAYWLFHSWRLFGYFALSPLLVLRPVKSLIALASYAAIHRRRWWQRAVHKFLGYGASRKHRIASPYRHLIRDDKRYLWCLHPHGVLADGWHSIIARNENSFDEAGNGPPELDRKIALCFAPIIQHVPVHQEMYRDRCGAADRKAIVRWWNTPDTDPALIPGGFAEAVFANAGEREIEYAYIKDRKGFMRICIEEGKDIVPVYTFRVNWMYRNPAILRGARARFSQNYFLGLVLPFGWMGTSMPLTDRSTTVVFPPFEATKYKPSQLDEAHAAYLEHLKKYFDLHKEEYGMPGVTMKFIGNDFQDEDWAARSLRRIGVLSRQVAQAPKNTSPSAAA
mmetsp:Transcript_6288/g.14420  ORF Transcript_6288/g.14420 Transcript_6288/m.14420 type:complete len:382 (+) Transcript_6288:53-1198(+)|eukprot:CAMPEP_0197888336 /NCGR_PEP_ID=MMETSP1439-20131203/21934_1 /TAXON_ID=66791 /ORGANISM="Gonyaulax spinifera, Strain CCMP409" /LENGTH=381 /DNA_ID=CAMNT_0043508243 /DNA_START=46 /DNA_END=1191 /DNA_ORIENTATION=-